MRQVPQLSCLLADRGLFTCHACVLSSRQQLARASGIRAELTELKAMSIPR